jgi:dienelactone hydrolase
MTTKAIRSRIRELIGLGNPIQAAPQVTVRGKTVEQDYVRTLIEYEDFEGGSIPAYLLEPIATTGRPRPAVLVHHQHNSQWHLGKSEVCGVAGDPLQAFGPALAALGFVVLIPDSICFEDRRFNQSGIEPDDENDRFQHFLEMEYRLVSGDLLMRKVLHDATIGLAVLRSQPNVDVDRIGALGHSYGGNTVLFQMAVDNSIGYGCSSGAACTYLNKKLNRVGLEMALVIPGFCREFELTDVVSCIAPRKLMLVSGSADQYSRDADVIYENCKFQFVGEDGNCNLHLKQYVGDHQLTEERFAYIIDWFRGFVAS